MRARNQKHPWLPLIDSELLRVAGLCVESSTPDAPVLTLAHQSRRTILLLIRKTNSRLQQYRLTDKGRIVNLKVKGEK